MAGLPEGASLYLFAAVYELAKRSWILLATVERLT
jgi:hypothetical protein